MSLIIAAILTILRFLGLVISTIMSGLILILLVVAIVVIELNINLDRKSS